MSAELQGIEGGVGGWGAISQPNRTSGIIFASLEPCHALSLLFLIRFGWDGTVIFLYSVLILTLNHWGGMDGILFPTPPQGDFVNDVPKPTTVTALLNQVTFHAWLICRHIRWKLS